MTPPNLTSAPVGESTERPPDPTPKTKWPRYVEAVIGYSEHWYPAAFSDELEEGGVVAVTLLGKNILLTRTDGQARAISDRCAHRGVKFSAKPLCLKKDTVTCWYHGWTYDLEDGQLIDILTSPGSSTIGQVTIPVYATEEAKGIIFVFVGEAEPHPLRADVPPGFLDPDTYVRGIRRRVQSNWRLGAENGIDNTHAFIHRDSPLIPGNNLALPLGLVASAGHDHRASTTVVNNKDEWPKGVIDHFGDGAYLPVFDAKIKGETVLSYLPQPGAKRVVNTLSLWLPCAIKVDPWPDPALISYEFYVPVNKSEHEYFQLIQSKVSSESDIENFCREFEDRWTDLALHGFNDDDVFAREATEEFYADGNGWRDEHLFGPDHSIVRWRQLCSKHGREIAR
ncbi:Rieske 2Fe-2S domain-containing protein [Mycolicibacterium novocastrense]|uniref:Rieske 2Fe-2S domain-containing protein n=1 Tax=Mycolicibacterium novocastrense TaxID=59813 RepID=UPI0009E7512D|nr:Rieske 2Fe-2S domain-containing protein [Mycolicibacterium novocastrense]